MERRKPIRGQLIRYLITGCIAALVHLVILIALVEIFGITPIVATGIGFSGAVAANYTLQYHWTFSVTGRHPVMFARYLAVTLFMLAVNTAIFWLLNERMGLAYVVAQVIATSIVVLFNFQINRRYTFRQDG